MGVRIKIAATTEELDELFEVRHRVFVREKRYFTPIADGRLLDRFDAFPTTANIVALYEGHVIGGVRIVEPSGRGVPADEFFDFRPYLPEGAIAGSGSMLVMDEEFRKVPRVTFAMLGMMYYWALCKGMTHITGVAAPEAVKLFLGSGYKPVAPTVVHGPSQLPALPVVLNIVELNDRFSAFVDKHQFRHFLQSFERQFHQKGEYIIRSGEAGTSAYVIIEGRVGVSVSGKRRSAPNPPEDQGRVGTLPPPTPRITPEAPGAADDDGPISVRNPGRMTDRGHMSAVPASVRAGRLGSRAVGTSSNDLPTPQRSAGRSNEVVASFQASMNEVPISTRSGPAPASSRASGVPSSRVSGPPSSRPGAPVSVREMGPGEVFGELSLITAQPRSADVVALTDVDLMVLERDAFYRQVSQNPEVALNLLSVIGNRLMSVTDRLSEVTETYVDEAPSRE